MGVIIGKCNNVLSALDLLKGMIMTQTLYVLTCLELSQRVWWFYSVPSKMDKVNSVLVVKSKLSDCSTSQAHYMTVFLSVLLGLLTFTSWSKPQNWHPCVRTWSLPAVRAQLPSCPWGRCSLTNCLSSGSVCGVSAQSHLDHSWIFVSLLNWRRQIITPFLLGAPFFFSECVYLVIYLINFYLF